MTNPNDQKKKNGLNQLHMENLEINEEDTEDIAALDKELDELNSALDKVEDWSNSLHDKVAELLKQTREQNQTSTETTPAPPQTDGNEKAESK